MKRDLAALAALGILTIFALGAAWVRPAHSASRLYPYLEVSRVMENDRKPKDWASIGCPVSLGRFAPSLQAGISNREGDGLLDGRVIVAVRYKL